ncbi:hypothetical protein BD779DRAFT_1667471 [Infundibulicybe gibba]|nr:hypothetical protein BD779DRAFT_1667471 [Infundibulicybe gibba]
MDNPDFDRRPHSTEDDYDVIGRLASQLQFTSPNQITPSQIRTLITALPRLTEAQIISLGHQDSVCPICLTPFLALLAEEETALAMDSPAHPVEELGVTRLAETWQCGHAFCRRE